jgi:hypothetical protein
MMLYITIDFVNYNVIFASAWETLKVIFWRTTSVHYLNSIWFGICIIYSVLIINKGGGVEILQVNNNSKEELKHCYSW